MGKNGFDQTLPKNNEYWFSQDNDVRRCLSRTVPTTLLFFFRLLIILLLTVCHRPGEEM